MNWRNPVVDFDLIKKYDKPGPRYTSYPTAPCFSTSFGNQDFLKLIQEAQERESKPLSLYFHLPFCRSVCYFCGCNVVFTKHREWGDRYIDRIETEMDRILKVLDNRRPVVQVHFGGGTPTFMTARQLERLIDAIHHRFTFAEDAEIGVEIDPREATEEQIYLFREKGFNRMSMGIQDFDPRVQEAVHRIQSEELTRRTVQLCRDTGWESINVDLIYGLPFQTVDTFKKTVDIIIDIDPDRIAVFNFAYLPEMIKHQRVIDPETLPSREEKLRILEMVIQSFTDAGYVYIGMDHFAKPTDELTKALFNRTLHRNFQGYTTKGYADLIAFGVSSISMVGEGYAQNEKDYQAYLARIDEEGMAIYRGIKLHRDDKIRRDLITRLMCHFMVIKKELEDLYGIQFDDYFQDELEALQEYEKDELLVLGDQKIEILPLGRLLIRNIAMEFDAYLKKGLKHAFSRTV